MPRLTLLVALLLGCDSPSSSQQTLADPPTEPFELAPLLRNKGASVAEEQQKAADIDTKNGGVTTIHNLGVNAVPWSRFRIDGGPQRETPAFLQVRVGEHEIVFECSDGRLITEHIEVKESEKPFTVSVNCARE